MPSYESRHMLRVLDSPEVLAKSFISYCKRHNVTTRGRCRIGFVHRSPPHNTHTRPENYLLRGLIANRDISKDENVVIMPVTACLHPGAAFRCEPFWRLLAPEVQVVLGDLACAYNSRIVDRSLIRHNQLLLALYMTYLVLQRNCNPPLLSAMPGGDAIDYINFMPRNEGNFEQLAAHLAGWLDAPEICRSAQASLASHFQLTQAEVRPVIIYALCMIYSRMVPMDHRACLQYALQSTPLARAWDNIEATAAPAALPPPSSAGVAGVGSSGVNPSLVRDPISFLCPVIDMCNHSDNENVAVMVPDHHAASVAGPAICLRTLCPVAKGEELTMKYGAAPHELKLIWGMQDILQ
ncbi:putative SET domain containing protein [Leishmania naiffi]|uniref:SET domain containing protein n=1 Tax=Leishmania naiffi TaxID=5678 RepID=A0AAW3BRW2_9TRYP